MSFYVSPEEAAEELLRRRRARSSLLEFTTYTFGAYIADPVHELIAAELDGVIAGETRRLMIFAPPQHGKSELTSVRLPAAWLGRRPNDPVILSSYGASLAESKSRQVRDIVESEAFSVLHPLISTRQDSRAVQNWRLATHRGSMLAVGVGGPVTGHGAQLGIIDDPHENWEQAQSKTMRDKVWDWFRGTFRTRIWEGGAIVLIMTRWHEDDLAGRLLADQPGQWRILRLPALAESQADRDENNRRMGLPEGLPDPLGRAAGEPLSPKRFSAGYLGETKRDVGSMVWAAEYQGAPRVPEGNRFKREWFQIVDVAPVDADRVRYWDLAASEAKTAKRTAGVLMSRTRDGHIYIENVVKGKLSPHKRDMLIKQTATLDSERTGNRVKIFIEQEPGSSGVDTIDDLTVLLGDFPVAGDRATGDKDVRLEPFAAQAEAGNVYLVRGDWNGDYIDEMCAVPNGFYRDQADATAGAYNRLPKKSRLAAVGASVVEADDLGL